MVADTRYPFKKSQFSGTKAERGTMTLPRSQKKLGVLDSGSQALQVTQFSLLNKDIEGISFRVEKVLLELIS